MQRQSSAVQVKDKFCFHFSHLDSKTVEGFSTTGYFCPQCKSKYCELPIECKACGMYSHSYSHIKQLTPPPAG